jgi:hypothetical protein
MRAQAVSAASQASGLFVLACPSEVVGGRNALLQETARFETCWMSSAGYLINRDERFLIPPYED